MYPFMLVFLRHCFSTLVEYFMYSILQAHIFFPLRKQQLLHKFYERAYIAQLHAISNEE